MNQKVLSPAKQKNHLDGSTSPYLLQHVYNPVDWYPWGREALETARRENKPIFLSIGYAACHWCHVMEHESFENEEVARVLNEHFVAIKVDREERPDVDEIYMQYTVALTGSGGWPMSVFLTPDLKPFHAGTYFPRETFVELLKGVAEAWHDRRDELVAGAGLASEYLNRWARGPAPSAGPIRAEQVGQTAMMLAKAFDPRRGGLVSGRNKFPPAMAMELMLREYCHSQSEELLNLVELTLDQMACGGIYDQLGGGIHRYSTDPEWLVPHFEKMLYDQALVSSIYLDAYQLTHKPMYARVAREIFDYVIGDLQAPEGGFYSTRDADSEGMEGKYYVWTLEEVEQVLGPDDAAVFAAYYDVTRRGNWHDPTGHAPPGPKNILRVLREARAVVEELGLSQEDLEGRLQRSREKLRAVRLKRVPPGLDDKILTDWNGLMIASMAKGARVLDDPRYAAAAGRAAEFVLSRLRRDGRLLHTYREGKAHLMAYLSDYAFLIEGLLNLYEATFDTRWLREAKELTDVSIAHYYDAAASGFYFTADDHEELLARVKTQHDGAVPAGSSVHAMNLLRLALFFDSDDYRAKAESIFRVYEPMVRESPGAAERLLCAVDFHAVQPKAIALVASAKSDGSAAALQGLIRAIYNEYIPNKVVAFLPEDDLRRKELETQLPLLRGKRMLAGQPTAYVCENFVCKQPVTSADDLTLLLKQAVGTRQSADDS
jgi:hypothetical protein